MSRTVRKILNAFTTILVILAVVLALLLGRKKRNHA